MQQEMPAHPAFFSKVPTTVIGPYDTIPLHAGVTGRLDWEVELAVVIGKQVRRATGAEAEEAIAGFTVLNDITARDWQFRTREWLQGKNWDSTTPVGPWLVTPDELGDPQDVDLWLDVNGQRRQTGNTRTMIFGVAHIVSYLSRYVTLLPGDLIYTGTYPTVPGKDNTVKPGDVVEVEVDGVGTLSNPVEAGS